MDSSSQALLLGDLHRRRATLDDASVLTVEPEIVDADDGTLLLNKGEKHLHGDVDDGEVEHGWSHPDTGLAKARAVRAGTRRSRRCWIVVGLFAGKRLAAAGISREL
jgi:hypothetical protein